MSLQEESFELCPVVSIPKRARFQKSKLQNSVSPKSGKPKTFKLYGHGLNFPMYEHHTKPLLPRRQFFARARAEPLVRIGLIIVGSLGLGMIAITSSNTWAGSMLANAVEISPHGPLAPIQTRRENFAVATPCSAAWRFSRARRHPGTGRAPRVARVSCRSPLVTKNARHPVEVRL